MYKARFLGVFAKSKIALLYLFYLFFKLQRAHLKSIMYIVIPTAPDHDASPLPLSGRQLIWMHRIEVDFR